jgi:hypothetical protein
MPLPDLPPISEIRSRLAMIFPEGTPNRAYFTREMAARVVFVMLYSGALERLGGWLGPKHVYGMSDAQAELLDEQERLAYGANAQEERLISSIGLRIDRAKVLPDILFFDLKTGRELLVFVEVVATDGPVSESRKQALLEIAHGANISPDRIAFVTAYRDRGEPAFKRTFGSIAWNTLVWFMAEPDHILMLREKPSLTGNRIFDLIREEG